MKNKFSIWFYYLIFQSALKAQLMSSEETLSLMRINISIRPCSTNSRRELPSRQQMAFNSLADGGGTPEIILT